MKLIDRLLDSLASGEVVAVALAGIFGWGWAEIRRRLNQGREREIELGRLRFKQENAAATQEAVREGMAEIKEIILPAIQEIKCDLQEVKHWLGKVDNTADEALRLAQTVRESQAIWLKRAETEISAILSANGPPTIVKNLFKEDLDNDEFAP